MGVALAGHIWAHPFQALGADKDALDNNEIRIIDACCCCYEGLVCGGECCGCMGSTKMLCCEYEFCCKSGVENLCCICMACRCEAPSVCIKQQAQLCCIATAAAIPCDDEVPCMFGTCGLICYPTVGCCRKMGEITGVDSPGSGAGGEAVGAES